VVSLTNRLDGFLLFLVKPFTEELLLKRASVKSSPKTPTSFRREKPCGINLRPCTWGQQYLDRMGSDLVSRKPRFFQELDENVRE